MKYESSKIINKGIVKMNFKKVFESTNGEIVTDTLRMSKDFGKEHKNIMRDIRNIIDNMNEEFGVCSLLSTPNIEEYFIESTYIQEQNKQEYSKYELTEKGFMLLISNWKGFNRIKYEYIEEYHAMKQYIEETNQKAEFDAWRTKEAHETYDFYNVINSDEKCISLSKELYQITCFNLKLDRLYKKEELYQMYREGINKEPWEYYLKVKSRAVSYVETYMDLNENHFMSNVVKQLRNKYIKDINEYKIYVKNNK